MKMYKTLKFAVLMTASAAAWSSVPSGWYAGLFGEASRLSNVTFTLPNASVTAVNSLLSFYSLPALTSPFAKATYLTGWGGGGQVGYRYCGWRFEGELLYNKNNINKLYIGNYAASKGVNTALPLPYSNFLTGGHATLGSALFNVYYDFFNDEYDDVNWLPYLGLGVGYGRFQDTLISNFASPSALVSSLNVINFKQNTSTAVGQAIIGLSYLFGDNFSGGLDYRYMTTRKLNNFHSRFNLQMLSLNVNYWFGDN